jgi:hypothetical protein
MCAVLPFSHLLGFLDERYSLNLNECWSLIGFLQDTINDELPWPPLVPMGHDARVIAGE